MKTSREIILSLDVKSSYTENNIGLSIYDYALNLKPNKIIEFGVLNGYSAICFGLALRDLGRGKVYCYDLWEKYPYNHGDIKQVQAKVDSLGLTDYVHLDYGDVYEWSKSPESFDLLHVDVSNDGQRLQQVLNGIKESKIEHGPILFEGGTVERDAKGWKTDRTNAAITAMKFQIGYRVLDERFPGLSLIDSKEPKHPVVIPLEVHSTPEGNMIPVFKDWNSPVGEFVPRMVYHTTMKSQSVKGPMLHRRKAGLLSCAVGTVSLEYLDEQGDVKEVWLSKGDSDTKMAVYVPPGVPVRIVNYTFLQEVAVTNTPSRPWYPEDNDTTKWSSWEEFKSKAIDL